MTNQAHPLASRVRAFMSVREIAHNFSGGPSLLVSGKLAPAGATTPDFGLDTIFVTAQNANIYFFRDAQAPRASDFVEIPLLPADLLAIVATPDDAPQLSALWTERGLEAPPVVVVKDATEALGPILARAKAELAAVSARCAELQCGLVATRMEFEETRAAMHGVMRTLSHRYATKMNLVAAAVPSPGRTAKLEASAGLRHLYPVVAESVTCLALHVVEASLDHNAILKVVLSGAESGRVLGEWRVPSKTVLVGWNTFDLPMPVAAVRETITVTASLDAAAGSAVSFSLAEEATAGLGALLAIRIWTADPGGRFPHANHWVWNALGEVRLPAGTVSLVAADPVRRMTARGLIEQLGENSEGSSPAYLLLGGSSLLCLPDLDIRHVEAVCVELGLGLGDLRDARFALVAQSTQHSFTSGWRSFAFPDKTLRLGLSLPTALPDTADLYLRIEDGERTGDDFATLELRRVEIVAGERTAFDLGSHAPRVDPEALPDFDPQLAGARFARLKAHNHSETEKYALFDVMIGDLEFGGRVEPAIKLKPSMARGRLSLEFRRGQNWPDMFRDWPGRQQDRFGDVFRVMHTDGGLAIIGELTTTADRELLEVLCRLMPTIIATSVQMLPNGADRLQAWLDVAREFTAAAQRTFAEVAP